MHDLPSLLSCKKVFRHSGNLGGDLSNERKYMIAFCIDDLLYNGLHGEEGDPFKNHDERGATKRSTNAWLTELGLDTADKKEVEKTMICLDYITFVLYHPEWEVGDGGLGKIHWHKRKVAADAITYMKHYGRHPVMGRIHNFDHVKFATLFPQ